MIRILRDASSVTLSLESGEADAGTITDASSIARLTAAGGLDMTPHGFEGIGPIQRLAFNTRVASLNDKRVRQAIAYSMDRAFILGALTRGVAASQKGPILESSPFFNPDMPGYNLDLDRANALLDEAGHPRGADGTRFALTMETIPARAMMGLIRNPPGHVTEGSITFDGEDITRASNRRLWQLRGRDIAMIFQEPMTSLNPVFTIGNQIAEAILLHQDVSRAEADRQVIDLLATVGTPEPEARATPIPRCCSRPRRRWRGASRRATGALVWSRAICPRR